VIADVDHGMMLSGDVVRGAEAHVDVTRAVEGWLELGVVREPRQ